MSDKLTFELPMNPDHYYGLGISVEHLKIGDLIFFKAPYARPTEVNKLKIDSFGKTEDGKKYQINCHDSEMNLFVLTALPNTRVQYPHLSL